MKQHTNKTLWEIFKIPLFIALVSVIGLVSALLGDGILDVLSWLLLSVPIYACRYLIKFQSRQTTSKSQR